MSSEMSKHSRKKDKHGKSSRLSLHDDDVGSSARTRPFSFDEIMLRRKNKNLSENVNGGAAEAETSSREGIVEHVSHGFESERGYGHLQDSSNFAEMHLSEEPVKQSSRYEEKNSALNANSRDDFGGGKDRGSHETGIKVKARLKSVVNEVKGSLDDSQIYGRRKNEVSSRKEEKTTSMKAKYEDEFHKGKDRQSSNKETQSKARLQKMDSKVKGGKYDKETFDRGKYEKLSKDLSVKESHADRSKGNSERVRKRKYENGDDEKIEVRISAKKHDPGRHHDSDISERKDRRESSKLHVEESRQKRIQSRSKDRQDRNRRSTSHSPRAHKHASSHRGEHKELPAHSLKDRSGRLHSDVDRSRVSNNGSSRHYPRNGDFASGLGGYSPRKRRTEAAAKTPPPANYSPVKKSAKWDLPPAATDKKVSTSVPSNFDSSINTVTSNAPELASAAPVASTTKKSVSEVFASALSTKKFASVDSVQLTQATRPMRRLYVENVPSSVSEKAMVEYLNGLLLSSGFNHIQGIQPCISCIINKEKGQAVVEFLTPEDALAALSFDGTSISGSTLKIRRPKDFVDMATGGEPQKSMAAADTTSNVVKDSPNKVFIGGISKSLSSKMLLEIVSAFGPLKAYHFEINEDLNEPCAFLEYADQSVTVKACAGLNGMKLGGKVLTVVQAVHSAASLENTAGSSLYKIPEHAKPLLKQPTQIIKLNNVFNVEDLSSLSKHEVEDIVEDIKLECLRFGSVKSINVVKKGNSQDTTSGACEILKNTETVDLDENSGWEKVKVQTDTSEAHMEGQVSGIDLVDNPRNNEKEDEVERSKDNKPAGCECSSSSVPEELPYQPKILEEVLECPGGKVSYSIQTDDLDLENKIAVEEEACLEEEDDSKKEENVGGGSVGAESHEMEDDDDDDDDGDVGSLVEVGSVFVEFKRVEASCTAAHGLHGRLYDGRIVTVEYVPLDHYMKRFPN